MISKVFTPNLVRVAAGRVLNHRATCPYTLHPEPHEITEDWLNSFLSEYKIARNVPVEYREDVVRILVKEQPNIADLKAGDEERLLDIFHRIEHQIPDTRYKNFPSLVSKVIWAINPEGGIVYDRFASIGLWKVSKELAAGPSEKDVRTENYQPYIRAWSEVFNSAGFRDIRDATGKWLESSFIGMKSSAAFERHLLDQCLVLCGMDALEAGKWRYLR
jgi:hypothetical protein